MGVVVITTKENVGRDFIKKLHSATNEGVKLVIVTRPKKRSSLERLKSLYNHAGFPGVIVEMWYAAALRFNKELRNKLSYFKKHPLPAASYEGAPAVVEVNDINTAPAYELLVKSAPSLIVLWDAPIVKENILGAARQWINLHMGVCPHYRGAVANQFALYQNDFSNIGATIHYVNGSVDVGNIIEVIKGDVKKPPKEMFEELNHKSQEALLSVATRIFYGEEVHSTPQDNTVGKNFKLKYWTPSVRYKTAHLLARWEQNII